MAETLFQSFVHGLKESAQATRDRGSTRTYASGKTERRGENSGRRRRKDRTIRDRQIDEMSE